MAKKMQRLDESPDFRPFKFRIQAFTNAFLEELARQGYPEDKIPMKKVRLPLISSMTVRIYPTPFSHAPYPRHPDSLDVLLLLRTSSSCLRPYIDPKLPLELVIHLALQRGWEEGQVKGQPHLEHRSEKVGRRQRSDVVVPTVPPQASRRAARRRVRSYLLHLYTYMDVYPNHLSIRTDTSA